MFQFEVYFKVDRPLTGLTAQQKGTTFWWYSNKTSLYNIVLSIIPRKRKKTSRHYYQFIDSTRHNYSLMQTNWLKVCLAGENNEDLLGIFQTPIFEVGIEWNYTDHRSQN